MSDRQAKILRKSRRRMQKVLATVVTPIPGVELKLELHDYGAGLKMSGFRDADGIRNAVYMRADRRWRRMEGAPWKLRHMLNYFFTTRRPLETDRE